MSKKLKLSPWHSGDVKPVRSGVYEVRAYDGLKYGVDKLSYAFFDSEKHRWTTATDFNSACGKFIGIFEPEQNKQWRGILK